MFGLGFGVTGGYLCLSRQKMLKVMMMMMIVIITEDFEGYKSEKNALQEFHQHPDAS